MILGLIEHDRGQINTSTFEMLTAARTLAEKMGLALEVVAIGSSSQAALKSLGVYGVERVHLVEDPRLDTFAPEAWASALVQAIETFAPKVFLAGGSDRGNELMARVASILDQALAANCIELIPETPFRVKRVRWGGSLYEEASVEGVPVLLTTAPLTFSADPSDSGSNPEVSPFSPVLTEKDFRVRIVGRDEPAGGISLADARVVVGGGRGVGSEEGFSVLEDLAGLLGGAVGGSRVATNNGWRPHADQIGQTGTRIGPDLYIACGISGAIQHWVGCMGSKKILVINTDKEAPIVAKSSYAVIGDLHEVIPAICVELKKRKGF